MAQRECASGADSIQTCDHTAKCINTWCASQDGSKGDRLGLAPRCIEAMFKAIKSLSGGGGTVTTHVSFIEIYQENVRDLGKAVSQILQKGVLMTCCPRL